MKPLTGNDAFFLYAETPRQHMHTVGTIVLDPSTAPRKVPLSLTSPVLVDDPDFDFNNHVHHIALPVPL